MARPEEDDPPESLIVNQFSGIKNTVGAERLLPSELERARNVDIDDIGQVRRRRGYTRVATGDFHSLHSAAGRLLGVKDGQLGLLSSAYGFTTITTGGQEPLSYVTVGDTTYYASLDVSGKILPDATYAPWGQVGGAGEWVSPVLTPTDTLGEVAGRMLTAPPLATDIEVYNGRIYLAAGPVLWATELYLFDKVDRTRGYLYFEDDITMLKAVDDGLYVGTEKGLYFLSGTFAEGLARKEISSATVIRRTCVRVPAEKAHPAARQGAAPLGQAIMFLTTDGVYGGFNGGEAYNLTQGRVVFPSAMGGAALYREQDGVNSYVAVTDSGGSPASKARIGDYVDAEIRRFQGG